LCGIARTYPPNCDPALAGEAMSSRLAGEAGRATPSSPTRGAR